jgi:RNA polymerase sigma-70 factor (ECF subfamily)
MPLFRTTSWSLVLTTRAADEGGRAALAALCAAYRPPVLAYIRHLGHGRDDAEDLAQGFFTLFLERELYADADPARGRFRALLLTALRRYLINAEVTRTADKRGGGARMRSLAEVEVASRGAPASADTPEQAFQLCWAVSVIDRALDRLRREAEAANKHDMFAHLREFLLDAPDKHDYERVGATLGMRPNTLSVAVHRLRQRLREAIREDLLDGVAEPGDVDQELAELRAVLGSGMN